MKYLWIFTFFVLHATARGENVTLSFEPRFEELPVGDLVFYEVSVTNHSQTRLVVEQPCVGRNIRIELFLVSQPDYRQSSSIGSRKESPEPIAIREPKTWDLGPGETKRRLLLVNLWTDGAKGWGPHLEAPEDRYIAFVSTQPMGAYRDIVVHFAPFTQKFATSKAIVDDELLSRLFAKNGWIEKNSVELNRRLLHVRKKKKNTEAVIHGIIKHGRDSVLQRHCRMHSSLAAWVNEGLSEAELHRRVDNLVASQDSSLRAWYCDRITDELKILVARN